MRHPLRLVLAGSLLLAAGSLWWRRAATRRSLPCPAWLSWLLENPVTETVVSSTQILERLGLQPGMRVLDVGSGPGRLSLPAAQRVAPTGEVVALDIQQAMLDKLGARARAQGVLNVRPLRGGAGQGLLEPEAFDRALLVTVLGEIPDREAALQELYLALKPGGALAISEVIFDPHYQSQGTIRRLAAATGFHIGPRYGNALAFTIHLVKPPSEQAP